MDAGLTWYQALQLIALGPCLFIMFFLCVTARNIRKLIVPFLYFLTLSCSFLLPLTDALGVGEVAHGIFLAGETLNPAISFLLIIEFITGNMPSLIYWAILALPIIGGGSIIFVMLSVSGDEICIYEDICTAPIIYKQLYDVFGNSLIFLLIVAIYNRLVQRSEGILEKDHKSAIVLSLIVLNLSVLAITLLQISGGVALAQADIAITVVRIGFIYLVLTFVFRLFDRQLEITYERVPTIQQVIEPSARDLVIAESVRKLLSEDKIYRTMELTRESMAKKLAVTENNLSRIINKIFSMNFSALVNSYRVNEVKERLVKEKDTSITTIAFEAGFNSIPSFNRVFKQATGLSPSDYRSKGGISQPEHL